MMKSDSTDEEFEDFQKEVSKKKSFKKSSEIPRQKIDTKKFKESEQEYLTEKTSEAEVEKIVKKHKKYHKKEEKVKEESD